MRTTPDNGATRQYINSVPHCIAGLDKCWRNSAGVIIHTKSRIIADIQRCARVHIDHTLRQGYVGIEVNGTNDANPFVGVSSSGSYRRVVVSHIPATGTLAVCRYG